MFSDRINWIDLIFFHGFQMKPRKHNSASAKKRAEEPITGAFCLSSGKAKIFSLSCDPV
jgi:hypothetical protein